MEKRGKKKIETFKRTLTPNAAPTIIPNPCDISVTSSAMTKKKPRRKASSGWAVIKYVIKTYSSTHVNCKGKSATVNAQ